MEIRDRIKEKADELFRRYGIKSVTMDEIATQLGVSKKTIYQSFDDKNQLVDEVIADMLNSNRHTCEACGVQAKDAIHEIYLSIGGLHQMLDNMNPSILFDIERAHPNSYKKFVDYKYKFLYFLMKNNLERGKKEGLYRPEINDDVIVKLRLESIMIPFNEELFPKNIYTLVGVQQEIIEYFLFGMVTPKGYKLISKYQKESLQKHII
jgi:TetR/AcrR family transcriptional regulator, cholesterol catabolism regulator